MNFHHNDQQQKKNIDQLLLIKEPVEINNVAFNCQEAYYHQKLLNGVQLDIKGAKGLTSLHHVDYLSENQEIVYCASSSIIIYSTSKRSFRRLTTVQGEIILIKVHFQKMINRQYIIWIEKQQKRQDIRKKNRKQSTQFGKKSALLMQNKATNNQLIQTYFGNFFGVKDQSTLKMGNQQLNNLSSNKRNSLQEQVYKIHIYDYTKNEALYEQKIVLCKNERISDVFLFYNHYKMYNVVVQSSITGSYIRYQNLKKQKGHDQFDFLNIINQQQVQKLQINHKLLGLLFISQKNYYLFYDKNEVYILQVKENMNNKTLAFCQEFINQQKSDFKDISRSENLLNQNPQLQITSQIKLDHDIISIAVNNQYLAILTCSKIYIYTIDNLMAKQFSFPFQQKYNALEPHSIIFQRSNILVSYKQSTLINVFIIKNKGLKLMNSTNLNLNNAHQIQKIFVNHINYEIFCIINFYQLETNLNNTLQFSQMKKQLNYIHRPAFVDVASCLLINASQSQAKPLNISAQKFKKIHTCPWLSSCVIETQEWIQYKDWRQSFQHKKCIALHPIGVYLVICFKEGFKIFIMTNEGLINTFKGDSNKDIQGCAISQHGNNIAIALINSVMIYDFYSCKKMRTISLAFGVSIQSIQYSGCFLVCILKSKKLYLYNSLDQYKQILIFNPKLLITQQKNDNKSQNIFFQAITSMVSTIIINCLYYDSVLNFIIFSANNHIYFYNCQTQAIYDSLEFQNISFIYYYQNLNTLFLGTMKGQIVSFTWPNKPMNLVNQKRRLKAHKGKVLDIKVSEDFKQLISIGQDNTLSIFSLTYVSNLKKLEGLELIEHLSGNIKISYDLLYRKGFSQYTHSKYNDKMDLLKQYEDEILNVNFILPEQRLKQKQQMLHTIALNKNQLSLSNKRQIHYFSEQTNQCKLKYNKIWQQLDQIQENLQQQLKALSIKNHEDYMSVFNKSQQSRLQLTNLKNTFKQKLQQAKASNRQKLKRQQQKNEDQLCKLQRDYLNQKQNLSTYKFEQLAQIDQQKKQFISIHLQNINEIITNYNNNNGMMLCRNNKLQNEILDIKNKIQEFKFILYKLRNNLSKLESDKQLNVQAKEINKKMIEKEDKLNLGAIQKRYVKETKNIIDKNKQIDVFLIYYQKQKNILVHLEKQLENIEQNTEQLVQNILFEKKWRHQQSFKQANLYKLQATSSQRLSQALEQKITSKNIIKNYLHQLNKTIKSIISNQNTTNNCQLLQKLLQKNLISNQNIKNQKQCKKQKILLNKIIHDKLSNEKIIKSTFMNTTMKNNSTRRYNTENNEINQKQQKGNGFSNVFTSRDQINEKQSHLFQKLNVEQKLYKRIKTQQVVFENRKKKIYLQNEDLIQNYNHLMMEKKTFLNSFKKQQANPHLIKKDRIIRKSQDNPTPFQQYLKKKNKVDYPLLKPLIVKRQNQ